MIPAESPALTWKVAAWLCEVGWAVVVQPVGPWAFRLKVRSWAVSFLRVRLNWKVVDDGPFSDGKSVVSVTEPAADALTVIVDGERAAPRARRSR